MANYNFNLLSLNARGIRDYFKRKSIFTWVKQQNADIVFLQETYSTPDIENEWKFQWQGKMLFAHGTNHSRGVLILFNNELHFEIKSEYIDTEGRYILVEATIQDSPFLLVNLCAPTKSREQCKFFDDVKSALDELDLDPGCEIIIGGDFNTHLNPTLDNLGGRIETKPSVRRIKELMMTYDLIDIWRIHHPLKKALLGLRKSPLLDAGWISGS